MLYRTLLRPLLFSIDPETVHHLSFGALRLMMGTPLAGAALGALLSPRDPALEVRVLGRTFPTPIGLAAGFDKDAIGYDALARLGFGFVEVGTLTARAQPGNDRPRLFRLPADRALLNRMGFNNRGAGDAARRLARARRSIVGVNIGKSKAASEAEAVADYEASARLLAPHADYVVVNVSSPNTPGLRDLQAVEKLAPILGAVRAIAGDVPLLVKIAPDLSDADVDAVTDLALELGLSGIVATNTTIRREGLRTQDVDQLGSGGISGAPLKARAHEVLLRIRRRAGDRLVLIAAGGIETAGDAWERIRAGASLVQVYTGFIYGGPLFARDLALGVLSLARAAGYGTVQAAIGSAV